MKKVIHRYNRDRPGGHHSSRIEYPNHTIGYFAPEGRRFIKSRQRRKERRQSIGFLQESLKDYQEHIE